MSYEKQTWAKGDIVTSAKLNHMEDGIAGGGGVLVVGGTIDGNAMTLDHTWQEIHDAGAAVLRFTNSPTEEGFAWISTVGSNNGLYGCVFSLGSRAMTFTTDSADGYPVAEQG